MILTCKRFVERVTDAHEGRLSTIDRISYRAHLAYCCNCARYVAQMEQTVAALRHAGEDDDAPPEAVANILAALKRPR